ncbi:PepSY-associated TM helix domain-containing protein [Shewanella youngdeokensis]|uniref:PepSY-associated TM helix domain-containing protein n=1 Tax=Shewanella youngdeokensis TaxID=2999068 RepID=A0ABZ0JVV9_9GAMM|nr:PepSY-associated TM helix domain-containing protein [Shewanella sp. DAU334]
MNVVPALKWFHNWVGFFISLAMLIVLTTGVYLGSSDMLKRLDDKGQQYQPLSIEQKAQITETLFERYPKISTVKFPTQYTPYIQASARGSNIALDTDLNELSVSKFSDSPVYSTVFWLHRNFLLDDFGKYFNAWASLLGGIITLVGVYLWWRVRKGFRLKQSIPTNTKSSSLVKSHIQLGLFISIPLFILCLSGFLITYKSLWLGAMNSKPATEISFPQSQANNWHSQLQTAQNIWPDSQLVSVAKARSRKPQKPGQAAPIYNLQFDTHSDVWLRAADRISINHQQGTIQSVLKHSDRPLSGKLASFVRPLHDALNMPFGYVLFITSVSVVGCVILTFSLVTFYRRTFKKKPKRS